MKFTFLIFLIPILIVNGWSDTRKRKFKDDFMFGVGTSAYQIEGAWNIDGKGECIWDRYLHDHPEVIEDGRNGDDACKSYYNYRRDVQMLRELGVNFYRFSISWARVLPSGFPNNINEKGLEYYENLINQLLKYNIEPMIVLYHNELPQTLQDLGGWANPLSVQWFEDYARVIFNKFASKVKYWITVNQPFVICFGYANLPLAPAVGLSGIGNYICAKNVMLAHAIAYRLYEKEYKTAHEGIVGIALSLDWADSINNKTENVDATTRLREFNIDFFVEPIFSKQGNFPVLVRDSIAKKSKEQGFPRSRLPELSANEVKLIKGSADFLGVNHYTTHLVKATNKTYPVPSMGDDVDVEVTFRAEWRSSQSPWLKSVPYGIYKLCLYINERYNYPQIFITEHGWSTGKGLEDQTRVENMREYLWALLLALEDGSDIKGYTAWSLMDNIEWTAGSSERFGLYEVDFDSDDKTRTARQSALVYKRIIQKRTVETDWKPKNLKIKITKKKFEDEL